MATTFRALLPTACHFFGRSTGSNSATNLLQSAVGRHRPGWGYTAGRPSGTAAPTLLIRSGRSAEYKRGWVRRLWELLQSATGAADDQIVIAFMKFLQDGPDHAGARRTAG